MEILRFLAALTVILLAWFPFWFVIFFLLSTWFGVHEHASFAVASRKAFFWSLVAMVGIALFSAFLDLGVDTLASWGRKPPSDDRGRGR